MLCAFRHKFFVGIQLRVEFIFEQVVLLFVLLQQVLFVFFNDDFQLIVEQVIEFFQ
jgi:hypothetical protein